MYVTLTSVRSIYGFIVSVCRGPCARGIYIYGFIPLNDTFNGYFNLFQNFFVCLIDIKIIICLKWNLSAHIKRLYQIVKAY